MAVSKRLRQQQILREAEGYLEFSALCQELSAAFGDKAAAAPSQSRLAEEALHTLGRMGEPGTFKGHTQFVRGEALKQMGRFTEALPHLREAAEFAPSNLQVWLSLGWCYKRVHRIDLAIEALEKAAEVAPDQPLVQYNLACYCSLARDKERALDYLSQAINAEPKYLDLIGGESDFDPLRHDPDFQALISINV